MVILDPLAWAQTDVQKWLLWAAENYGLGTIPLQYFNVPGSTLCGMTEEEFRQRMPQVKKIR